MTQTRKINRECPLKSLQDEVINCITEPEFKAGTELSLIRINIREEMDILDTCSKHTVTVSISWMLSGPVSWHHYLSLDIKS